MTDPKRTLWYLKKVAVLAEAVPALPPGWSEVEVALDAAVVLRIRDAAPPDPPWFDYAREQRPTKRRRR